jgi:hypothetical protein
LAPVAAFSFRPLKKPNIGLLPRWRIGVHNVAAIRGRIDMHKALDAVGLTPDQICRKLNSLRWNTAHGKIERASL